MNNELVIRDKYKLLVEKLISMKKTISTMESCTGGLIASLITDHEGASNVLKEAFVTYSNEAKIKQGVPEEYIKDFGVYSYEVSLKMCSVSKENTGSDISIGITGTFANADPNNNDSVPGLVFYTIYYDGDYYQHQLNVPTDKDRYNSKLFVADKIVDTFLAIIV